jgi:DNA polymerase III delta prime subunit
VKAIPLEELFPTESVVPEERQIGRQGDIRRLTKRMADRKNTLLLDERRVGKTSTALASLEHCASELAAVTLSVDLVFSVARTPRAMVDELVRQAAEQDVGKAISRMRRGRGARKALSVAESRAVGRAAKLLGVEEIADAAGIIDELTSGRGEATVGRVLSALEADAQLSGRTVVVFIDEIHGLTAWGDRGEQVQLELATAVRRNARRVTFLFAGSDQRAAKRVFGKSRPLHDTCLDFGLSAIAAEDWHVGLRERFRELGYEIGREELDRILESSGGHPRRTMQVCSHVAEWAMDGPGSTISAVIVERGIASAKLNPAWRTK